MHWEQAGLGRNPWVQCHKLGFYVEREMLMWASAVRRIVARRAFIRLASLFARVDIDFAAERIGIHGGAVSDNARCLRSFVLRIANKSTVRKSFTSFTYTFLYDLDTFYHLLYLSRPFFHLGLDFLRGIHSMNKIKKSLFYLFFYFSLFSCSNSKQKI